jgi:hypothetical protein
MKKVQVKRAVLADWLAALRSGKYKQGNSSLILPKDDEVSGRIYSGDLEVTTETCSFCCLGVKVFLEGRAEKRIGEDVYTDSPNEVDENFEVFLNEHALIEIKLESVLVALNDGIAGYLSDSFHSKLRTILDNNPKYKVHKRSNCDVIHLDFAGIADFVENELVEYVD